MRKKITQYLLVLCITLAGTQLYAQKQVLYLNNANSQQEEGTSVPGNDAVTRMLDADPNFVVTVGTVSGTGDLDPADLSTYDLIIIQESISSGNSAFKNPDGGTAGALALKNLTVPVIYNKSEAFRDGRAIFDADAGIAGTKSSISVTVDPSNQSNELFNGIDFSNGNDIRLFFNTANDNGTPGNIGLKVLNNLDFSNAAAGTLATTPEVTDPAQSIVINYIPAGTQVGTKTEDQASVDMVALAFGYGAQVRGDGSNITSEALTIWRNAAYLLTDMAVPTDLYVNSQELSMVLYLNNINSQQETGTSAPGDDAITRMLDADLNFMLTRGTIANDGTVEPSDLNLITQETL